MNNKKSKDLEIVNIYFGIPVKAIKKFSHNILDIMEKNNTGKDNSNFIAQMKLILESDNIDFKLSALFDNVNDENILIVSYFKHLLKEEIKEDALKSKNMDYVTEYLSCSIFMLNFDISDQKWQVKNSSGLNQNIILSRRKNNKLLFLNGDYSDKFICKYLQLDDSLISLVLLKAKIEDNENLTSLIYKSKKLKKNIDIVDMLDMENLTNLIAGKKWSSYVLDHYGENINEPKILQQFSVKTNNIKSLINILANEETLLVKLLNNNPRDSMYIDDFSNEFKIIQNLIGINKLATLKKSIDDNDFLSNYFNNAINECIRDVKLAAQLLNIENFESDIKILCWSILYPNLIESKGMIKIILGEEDQVENIESMNHDKLFQSSLDFIINEYPVYVVHQNLIRLKLTQDIEKVSKIIGQETLVDMLKNYDLSALPDLNIIKNKMMLESIIPINEANNKKVFKF